MNQSEKVESQSMTGQYLESLKSFFNTSLKLNLPVALWRLPNEKDINAIVQLSSDPFFVDDLENAPTGFIFNPFKKTSQKQLIKADLFFEKGENEIKVNPSFNQDEKSIDRFIHEFEELSENDNFDYTKFIHKSPTIKENDQHYISLVENCKAFIKSGYYQKIVPSRRAHFKKNKNFHPVDELIKLSKTYHHAFVSLVYVPGKGIWLGASPELLISINENKDFETISLAGTQSIPEDFDLTKASWTQKEIEEQALVSRYIVNCFKQIRLREYQEYGPKTVKAGNLIHLKTQFTVNMNEVNFPQLGTVMLDLLHPTSAICGMPMLPAANFLEQNEGYDREYFSGFLGPVNFDQRIYIFVNLRCCRIYKDGGIIFAGAGVTEDSDSESEWNETNLKFGTLLNVIGK